MLSEFAGAAQSLGAGAILVNPWNITDMAAAIEDALTMSDQVCLTTLPDPPLIIACLQSAYFCLQHCDIGSLAARKMAACKYELLFCRCLSSQGHLSSR